jgi:RNA polymerase sigma-70 factor, ECF subfamily
MPTEDKLPDLMSRVALRDRVAFERLYRASSAHLFAVSFRILRNESRADEVLQEAFMNIWHNAITYNATVATPMTWMINIVRNKAIDALRSGRSEQASTSPLDDEALTVAADPRQEPQRLFDDSLTKSRIDGCMQGLAAQQRQALALAYYNGMVHTDIAKALGAPLGTAKGWVRRGLDQLRSCLEAAGVTGVTES